MKLDSSFLDSMNLEDFIKHEDYAELDKAIISEMDNFEKELVPQGSHLNTVAHVKKFKSFLKSKDLSVDIEHMPMSMLATYLRYFYFDLCYVRKRMELFTHREILLAFMRVSIDI